MKNLQILHISDPHIRSDEKKNQAVAESLTFIQDTYPDHKVIVTGDIVDSGSEEQYRRAHQLLFPLWDRLFLVPGNHDKGPKGNLYNKDSDWMFDKFLAAALDQGPFCGNNSISVKQVEDVMFVGVDSNIDTNIPWRFASGEINRRQLRDLERLFDDYPDQMKILYFHHHPFIHSDPFMYLKNAEVLAQVIYGRVAVVCFGHKHVPGRWKDRWNIPRMLAADSLYDSDTAAEITINGEQITVQSVPIRGVT